jgi:hypothetical protein
VQVVVDGPDHHLARVQADPDLHLDPVPAADVRRVAADRLLHGQGRVTGAHGVVLMGDRGPKQRHDAVAHDLVDGALIAVHGVHQALQDRIEELSGLLRVTVGQELHGALQVREQHGHLLALAFQGSLRLEDLLGQVAGSVRLRRSGV